MPIISDIDRAKRAANVLYNSFRTTGILGNTVMPEDIPPSGVKIGSLEHIMFVTLGVTIDYQRDAHQLWDSARKTFEDPETNYLFSPTALVETPIKTIMKDMQKYQLSKKPQKDAFLWKTVGVTFKKKWGGDPRKFLADCGWDALVVLSRLKTEKHQQQQKMVLDYPFLRGDKIGPLWIKMLRDNAQVKNFRNLDRVPIPVDIHVARASLTIGVVRGQYEGPLAGIFPAIREVWAKGTEGQLASNRPMIALDLDESLWALSKFGCSKRDPISGSCKYRNRCEGREFCMPGIIRVSNEGIVLKTED